jgi:hypothetical protein
MRVIFFMLLLSGLQCVSQESITTNLCQFEGKKVKDFYRYVKAGQYQYTLGSRMLGFHNEFAGSLDMYVDNYAISLEIDGCAYRGYKENRHKKAWWGARDQTILSIDFYILDDNSSLILF